MKKEVPKKEVTKKAVKEEPKEQKPKSNNLEDVMQAKNKSLGSGTMFWGSKLRYNPPRLPIGVFLIDFISGGGAPLHGSTCFWGGETGAKTYLAICAMYMTEKICWRCFNLLPFCKCSQEALKMKTSWADIEGTLEREWVEARGANPESYLITLAGNGEEAIDCADASLQADDCGLVVLDSLGALVPEREMENTADASNMGVGAAIITRAVKKLKQRMIRERKREHPCAVVFVNQMRKKLNVQFGSKEGQPGGHAMRHEFSLLFRCGNIAMKKEGVESRYYDKERERKMASKHSCSVYKEKVFIITRSAEFILVKENIPVFGLKKGIVDDIKIVTKYAQEYGVLVATGTKGKYEIPEVCTDRFTTQKEVQSYFLENIFAYYQVQKLIIDEGSKRIKGK